MWLLGEEDAGDPSEPPAVTVFASCVAAPPWWLPVTGQSWNRSHQWCPSWSSQSASHPPAATRTYSHQTNKKKAVYQTWRHIIKPPFPKIHTSLCRSTFIMKCHCCCGTFKSCRAGDVFAYSACAKSGRQLMCCVLTARRTRCCAM